MKHTAIGLIIGAVAGGVIGRGGGCGSLGCSADDRYVRGIKTTVYAATGALVGAAAGAIMPAGRRWIELEGDRPIRVGSLELHPAIRVSLDERRR